MKALHIYTGFVIPTEEGFRKITGKHFGDFDADNYVTDDEGNETMTGSVILTAGEIKDAMHTATGQAYDYVQYDE